MTKTINGKKLFILTALAVTLTGLTLITTVDDADASMSGSNGFKCKANFGSFFDPDVTTPHLFSAGAARCNPLGKNTTLASVLQVTGVTTAHCIGLASPAGADSYGISIAGFVTFSMVVEQCFYDSEGLPAAVGLPFCGVAPSIYTSIATGTYAITGGTINGQSVTGGTGTVTSAVDHCAGDGAPFGNASETALKGTVLYAP
jgi:hypothetical protein